jgi:sugar O-acyltransferase (sialic acid O-acetyltransferase NeuD family)
MLSVNEPEAQVIELFVTTGMKVSAGDRLCTLETTKAAVEVEAEVEGYIQNVLIAKGQQVIAGTVIFEISTEPPNESPAELSVPSTSPSEVGTLPEGLLISEKGLRLAKELGVPLGALPIGALVTEAKVREFFSKADTSPESDDAKSIFAFKAPFDAKELLILGDGGHAKTVIDLVRQAGRYRLAGVVAEPPPAVSEVLGVPVLGGEEILPSLHDKGIRLMVNGVGATNRNRTRYDIYVRMAKLGFSFPRIVHPKAVVEPSAEIADGVQIFGMAFVGSAAQVGFGAIINTGAIVSHDCKIGDFAHVTPGAILAGNVEVGTGALIGMGATTAVGVRIGAWARIGNGARINGDVPPHAIVQAGVTWPLEGRK